VVSSYGIGGPRAGDDGGIHRAQTGQKNQKTYKPRSAIAHGPPHQIRHDGRRRGHVRKAQTIEKRQINDRVDDGHHRNAQK